MYYVIELTCIGPQVREVFKNRELAVQYTTALFENNGKHYVITSVELELDTNNIE